MDSVVIGYVHPDLVRAEFAASLVTLSLRTKTPIEAFIRRRSGPLIAQARNHIVRTFLDDYASPWLLMIDTDMVFNHDALDRLVAATRNKRGEIERAVMGGLCFHGVDEEVVVAGVYANWSDVRPTMYEIVEDPNIDIAFSWYTTWPENRPFEVGATGAAFLLVHREVFEAVERGEGRNKPDKVWPWFREGTNGRTKFGEDLTFCLRARLAGYPIWVHTGVQIGHMKSAMLGKVQ
jgi:GT2 family glycosyltransferase